MEVELRNFVSFVTDTGTRRREDKEKTKRPGFIALWKLVPIAIGIGIWKLNFPLSPHLLVSLSDSSRQDFRCIAQGMELGAWSLGQRLITNDD